MGEIPIKIYSSNYVVNRIASKIVRQRFDELNGVTIEHYIMGCYNPVDNHAFYFNGQGLQLHVQQDDGLYRMGGRLKQNDEVILNKLTELPEGSVLVFRRTFEDKIIPLAVRTFDGWGLQPFGKWLSKSHKLAHEIEESILNQDWSTYHE